ncbi:MAG: hypothetical protein RR561_07950 [Peptostreptococcus sp.]|uniref:hypothetical protein n=1 Tax=Peptostreptococcus sp. TaxID=1262 RepID=UPI002FC78E57
MKNKQKNISIIKVFALALLIVLYIITLYAQHYYKILGQMSYDLSGVFYIKLLIPLICFLIGILLFFNIKEKVVSRPKNKIVFFIILLILIFQIFMIDALFNIVIPFNPLKALVSNMNIELYDFIFSYNYLDGFDIMLGFLAGYFS